MAQSTTTNDIISNYKNTVNLVVGNLTTTNCTAGSTLATTSTNAIWINGSSTVTTGYPIYTDGYASTTTGTITYLNHYFKEGDLLIDTEKSMIKIYSKNNIWIEYDIINLNINKIDDKKNTIIEAKRCVTIKEIKEKETERSVLIEKMCKPKKTYNPNNGYGLDNINGAIFSGFTTCSGSFSITCGSSNNAITFNSGINYIPAFTTTNVITTSTGSHGITTGYANSASGSHSFIGSTTTSNKI